MLKFRPITDDDIPWTEIQLNKAHVKKWYEIPHLGVSIDDWIYEIKERAGEFCWLTHLIILFCDRPIGLCQYYKCTDSDEDFGDLPVSGAYGIDYFIGEEHLLGKGLGKKTVAALVEKIFSFPDAERVTADIDEENTASKNTLLSCGFVQVDFERGRYAIEKNRTSEKTLSE